MNNFIKRTITGIIYVACIVTAFMQPFAKNAFSGLESIRIYGKYWCSSKSEG